MKYPLFPYFPKPETLEIEFTIFYPCKEIQSPYILYYFNSSIFTYLFLVDSCYHILKHSLDPPSRTVIIYTENTIIYLIFNVSISVLINSLEEF
jgi:hypothetical protein